jgi:hypothetical protein
MALPPYQISLKSTPSGSKVLVGDRQIGDLISILSFLESRLKKTKLKCRLERKIVFLRRNPVNICITKVLLRIHLGLNKCNNTTLQFCFEVFRMCAVKIFIYYIGFRSSAAFFTASYIPTNIILTIFR